MKSRELSKPVVVFLRHGDYEQRAETPSAHQPYPLTPEGSLQAAAAGPLLREMAASHGWHWQGKIFTSPLLRAWQTAERVRSDLSGPDGSYELVESESLMERGLGSGANLTLAELEEVIARDPRCKDLPPNWKSDSAFRLPLPGAESLLEAGLRVSEFVKSVLETLEDSPAEERASAILFVGHGAAFRHAAHHLGVLKREDLARLSMFHARPVALQEDDSGVWRTVAGEWKVRETKSTHTLD